MFIGRLAAAAASEIIPPPPVTSSLLSTNNHMRCRTTLPREARDRRNGQYPSPAPVRPQVRFDTHLSPPAELYSDGILPSAERKHKVYNEIKALHGTKGYLLKTHQNWCSAKELELGLRPRKRRSTPPRPADADDIRGKHLMQNDVFHPFDPSTVTLRVREGQA